MGIKIAKKTAARKTNKAASKTKASSITGYDSGQQEQFIPLEGIQLDGRMGYREVGELSIDELAASIMKEGLNNPLIVWNGAEKPDEPGRVVQVDGGAEQPAALLVSGRRRYEALTQLKSKKASVFNKLFPNGVPTRVKSGSLEDMLVHKIVENVQRENPDSAELVVELARLRDDFGRSNNEIAKLIGKHKSWVSKVMMVKEELGNEGVDALAKGEAGLRDAVKAAASVRKAKKSGKSVSPKAALTEAKAKKAANRAAGRERSARRVSAEGVYQRYQRLSGMNLKVSVKLVVAEKALAYLAGKVDQLPDELSADTNDTSGETKKSGKSTASKAKPKIAPKAGKKTAKKVVRKAKK